MSAETLLNINQCIICYDPIDINIIEYKLFNECEHSNNYHIECVNNWINECNNNNITPSCPICRKQLCSISIDIQPNQIMDDEDNIPLKIIIMTSCIFIIVIFINNSLY